MAPSEALIASQIFVIKSFKHKASYELESRKTRRKKSPFEMTTKKLFPIESHKAWRIRRVFVSAPIFSPFPGDDWNETKFSSCNFKSCETYFSFFPFLNAIKKLYQKKKTFHWLLIVHFRTVSLAKRVFHFEAWQEHVCSYVSIFYFFMKLKNFFQHQLNT